MTISNTTFERFVEEEVTNVRDAQNSDAEVQTSSDFPTIAYYDVANNKIVIPNSESDEQMFGAYKTVTIKIWQEATDRFEACEKTITLGVKKYVTTSNGEDYIIKVNETKTANYGFTNTSASYPSNNLTDDFYYTIDEPNFENAALNNGTELITYDPATNEITGHNAGTTKITFFQKETYKYTGATLMCNISVEKRENQIANSWSNTWQKAMSENGTANISFSSTHGDYANYPISIEQIYGEDVATLTGDASGASITTNTTKGYAIWHLYQEENYEYGSAEADVMVLVGVPAPPTCYVYQDATEYKFSTSVWDAEGHFAVIARQIDKEGLVPDPDLVEESEKSTGVKIDLVFPENLQNLDQDEEDVLYRIVQESITNAIRHGKATHIDVRMERVDNDLRIRIADNGKGCDNIQSGFGLHHMQERIDMLKGTLSYSGKDGFVIEAVVPIRVVAEEES